MGQRRISSNSTIDESLFGNHARNLAIVVEKPTRVYSRNTFLESMFQVTSLELPIDHEILESHNYIKDVRRLIVVITINISFRVGDATDTKQI